MQIALLERADVASIYLLLLLELVKEVEFTGEHSGLVLRVLAKKLVRVDCFAALFVEVEVHLFHVLLTVREVGLVDYFLAVLRIRPSQLLLAEDLKLFFKLHALVHLVAP